MPKNTLGEDVVELKTDIKYIKEKQDHFEKKIDNIKKMLEDQNSVNDRRYALKWTEKLVWVVMILVISGAIVAVMKGVTLG